MKIPNKRELQQIALSHSSDFDFIKISLRSIKNVLLNEPYVLVKEIIMQSVIY